MCFKANCPSSVARSYRPSCKPCAVHWHCSPAYGTITMPDMHYNVYLHGSEAQPQLSEVAIINRLKLRIDYRTRLLGEVGAGFAGCCPVAALLPELLREWRAAKRRAAKGISAGSLLGCRCALLCLCRCHLRIGSDWQSGSITRTPNLGNCTWSACTTGNKTASTAARAPAHLPIELPQGQHQ